MRSKEVDYAFCKWGAPSCQLSKSARIFVIASITMELFKKNRFGAGGGMIGAL